MRISRSVSGRRRLLALLAACLLVAGCGSTVEGQLAGGEGAPGTLPGDGFTVPTSPSGGDPSDDPGLGGDDGGAGDPVDGPDLDGDGDPDDPGDPGLPPATAPGVTEDTIYIGASYTKNQEAANAALGVAGAGADYRIGYDAMIEEINEAGGLLGRMLKPVYYGYDAAGTQTANAMAQEACSKYTEDNKSFLIIDSGAIMDECAKKAGALQFGTGEATPETFRNYPQRIDIEGMNMVRMGEVVIAGLHRQGYFDAGARVGIATWDNPSYRTTVERGLIPALRRLGITPAIETEYLASPQTVQGVAETSADVNGAILRFATEDITHVLLFDGPSGVCSNGCLTIEWLNAAEPQGYRPRYGFNEGNAADAAHELGAVPERQLHRSVIVGWQSYDATYDEGFRPNPERERCLKIMREHGVPMNNVNQEAAALDACSSFWFLQEALTRLPSAAALHVANVVRTIEGFGYSWLSPLAYYSFFGPGRHDGTAGVRLKSFGTGCSCYEYAPGAIKV